MRVHCAAQRLPEAFREFFPAARLWGGALRQQTEDASAEAWAPSFLVLLHHELRIFASIDVRAQRARTASCHGVGDTAQDDPSDAVNIIHVRTLQGLPSKVRSGPLGAMVRSRLSAARLGRRCVPSRRRAAC